MQEKKLTKSKIVIEALRKHYGLKIGEFADMLGVGASTVSTWAARDSLDVDLVFRKCEGVNFSFLESGEGEMFAKSFDGYYDNQDHQDNRSTSKPIISEPETLFSSLRPDQGKMLLIWENWIVNKE